MVLEVAILEIKKGQSKDFEESFSLAERLISSQKGYLSHELKKCLEQDDNYLLLVQWETVEDHEIGFRGSEAYQEWKKILHHYYDPFPVVMHYQ
ncbi:antibiotic biosynthesis monooxygenase [Lutimonas halocynthiae]|uniref:antibiotic biosynthesis monooxygenase family protein n=1 Tax=Lutimonas halocynthiae TaxID=1446477 RepID=UPI0025B57BAA|nr:antibiotic biosynthesis monooxygenase [Lutimonas halocynthiae]MDN3643099.1 antibiotic biosynthesis monooxygenase [Lutimonas halocynthiae]